MDWAGGGAGAAGRRTYVAGVLGERPGGHAWCDAPGFALAQVRGDVDPAPGHVDADGVAVAQPGNRATVRGFGRDVPDPEAVRGAAETARGDHRDVITHALTVPGRQQGG